MASLIPELDGVAGAQGGVVARAVEATVDLRTVDVAVERVLRKIPEADRGWFVQALLDDPDNEVGQMLRESAARREAAVYRGPGKMQVAVPYVLDATEAKALEASYPEFKLTYHNDLEHDHPLAAMSRRLDDLALTAELPPSVRYADFGGNLMYHVRKGHEKCVVVGDVLDEHDATRKAQQDMELTAIARSAEAGVVTKRMAAAVAAGDGRYHVKGRLETFDQPMLAGKMTHVYDVPMVEIGRMMERCGMRVFHGVIHFNPIMWQVDQGFLPTIGARYVIDRVNDEFSMGFLGSGAKWYRHKWSQFQVYGADQVFYGRTTAFSYKVVRRRGDTLVFRILPIHRYASAPESQVFRSVYVDYVRVSGYKLDGLGKTKTLADRRVLAAEDKWYPRSTWERMSRYAAVEVAKGTLDYNALVATYRSMVATLRYNGVEVSATQIPALEVPQFIAWVSAHAVAEFSLLRRSTRAFTKGELHARSMANDGVVWNGLVALLQTASAAAMAPLALLGSLVGAFVGSKFGQKQVVDMHKLIVVRDAVVFEHVPASALLAAGQTPSGVAPAVSSVGSSYPFLPDLKAAEEAWTVVVRLQESATESLAATAPFAGFIEGEVKESALAALPAFGVPAVEPGGATCPSWLPFFPGKHAKGDETYRCKARYHGPEVRKDAIRDATAACVEEQDAVDVWMELKYAEAVVGGAPVLSALRSNRERWYNPDLWYVEGGRIVKSALTGAMPDTFPYMAVYCPLRKAGGSVKETGLYYVSRERVAWVERGVDKVEDIYRISAKFTGWVMTCAKTMVYNGPEMVKALEMALKLPMDFDGGSRKGGPGCGKTYTMVRSYRRGDCVTSPLKFSVEDLRGELCKVANVDQYLASRVCRTIDSFLVLAATQGVRALRSATGNPTRLLVDECYIVPAGRVYAVAALLGVKVVVAMGDKQQIPPGVRATYQLVYKYVSFRHRVRTWVVYRGCAAVLATFNARYGNKLRTVNSDAGSVRIVKGLDGLVLEGEVGCVCMEQADKPLMRRMIGDRKVFQSSTHEAQGKTYDTVVLFDLDPKPRPAAHSLLDNPAYVNVAYSRARRHVVLVKPGHADNLALRWARQASDPVLVSVCADLASVGTDGGVPVGRV